MMTDADMALNFDPEYRKIAERFRKDQAYFRRSLRPRLVQTDAPRHGPKIPLSSARMCPQEDLIWQDPVPAGRRTTWPP